MANAETRGLSGARNTGVRHASGAIVAFLDDDASARPGWLLALMRAFEDTSVIGVGGVALPVWESCAPAWLPSEFLWVVGCSYRGLPAQRAEIRNPIGANMAFRRAVLERVGGFSDGIGRIGRTPLGCEETELSIRARKMTGGRIVQRHDAEVEHLVSQDRASWSYFRRRCWAEGLSKVAVARRVGSDAALASERSYVVRTLPAGVWRGLADAARGDRSGLARAGAIACGLAITAAGYVRGLVSREARPTAIVSSECVFGRSVPRVIQSSPRSPGQAVEVDEYGHDDQAGRKPVIDDSTQSRKHERSREGVCELVHRGPSPSQPAPAYSST